MSDLPVRSTAQRLGNASEFARALQGELATRRAELTAARAEIAELQAKLATVRRETIEECAVIADGFTCGICGMDGKASRAIRDLEIKAAVAEAGDISELGRLQADNKPHLDKLQIANREWFDDVMAAFPVRAEALSGDESQPA